MAQGQLKTTPKPGSKKYEELKAAALGGLLDSIWIAGEAEELGISVTKKQIETELAQIKKTNFPTETAYQEFLKASHYTPEEIYKRVEIQLLSAAIFQEVKRGVPATEKQEVVTSYVDGYRRRWRAKTTCAPGYVIDMCSNS